MSSRKRKNIDKLFGGSLFKDFEKLFDSGYSISVTQTPEGTKVYAKVGKNTDVNVLRRRLEQQYPSAQIEIEGEQPLIKEISTRPIKEEDE